MRCSLNIMTGSRLLLVVSGLVQAGSLFAADAEKVTLLPGRFGQALDARQPALIEARDEYTSPPLTVECWVKLQGAEAFNIIVSCQPKESRDHWELYTTGGSGTFSAYLPGYTPGDIRSKVSITDDRWHYVAMVFPGNRVQLFVDGRRVVNQAVAREAGGNLVPGPLAVGAAQTRTHTLRCNGQVDELRLTRGTLAIETVPDQPFSADASTLGLWRFDTLGDRGEWTDESRFQNSAAYKAAQRVSLDELDRQEFKPGPSPMTGESIAVELRAAPVEHLQAPPVTSLDGAWQMAVGGKEQERLAGDWADVIPASVPGSVHRDLEAAGRIPDPKFARNDQIAHDASFETYWYSRRFARPAPQGDARFRLVFDGVAIRCAVWLNGKHLGRHDGMFGGPEFEVTDLLRDDNLLMVRIDPAPGKREHWNNAGWQETVVFNNVYGWHYSSIPALGIWRSVKLIPEPSVRLVHPFIATRDAHRGEVSLRVDTEGPAAGWAGQLRGTIRPDNFDGPASHFVHDLQATGSKGSVLLSLTVPSPLLWWPNDLGEQNLYRLQLSFAPRAGGRPDSFETTFGLRTITMDPLPGGPEPGKYNWTFVVNRRPIFVKGNGWCTMDSSMDFSRHRYDRLLSLAKLQHVQMVRGWGSGMPETDDFYDLCDRKGIMVLQEWPTAWNSHQAQPYDVLEETVRLNTLRLRNRPSLVMWGAGNESNDPTGKAIDMMGRYATELDGTRPYHRAEPWGGSAHNYDCYWGRQPLDHNLNLTAPFFGEFGLACMPIVESVRRYLPAEEQNVWPPPPSGSLAHHTPIFNTAEDVSRLMQYAAYFAPWDNLEHFSWGSQMSQAVGVRHTLELARTRWPVCSGALYYKLNDNYPAASWACVDWYGAPKLSHYVFQDAFAPLHACVLFKTLDNFGKHTNLAVWLLDDNDALRDAAWEVCVRAYDGRLKLIKEEKYNGRGSIERTRNLGEFALSAVETATVPLLVVVEANLDGRCAQRTFYCANFLPVQGCLLKLPRTRLGVETSGGKVTVTNRGEVPAVGVSVTLPGQMDEFTVDDGCVWIDAGQSHAFGVSETQNLKVQAWNADDAAAVR